MDKQKHFKACPLCGKIWERRADLLNDPEVLIVGYQMHFKTLKKGILLFNHSCKGTFGMKAEIFQDLYPEKEYKRNFFGTSECKQLCSNESDLSRCPNDCECSWVREIIQVIKNWQPEEMS